MKLRIHLWAGRWAPGFVRLLSTPLLLLGVWTVRADTSYTATGWVVGVPVPGLGCTNALGQIGMRGNAHVVRVQSAEPLLAGRRTIFANAAVQPDGSSILYGPAYHEVGTWDATGTNFTPTGGMWETSYRGTMGADGSLNLHLVGYGWGGTIDGMRLDETVRRAAGSILDLAIPDNYAGTIKPPPVHTNLMSEDFSSPEVCWSYWGPDGTYSYTRTGGQLVVSGYWPGVVTRRIYDSYTLGANMCVPGTAADGQTLEARVDLVSLSDSATFAEVAMGSTSGFYALWKGHDFVFVAKWSPHAPEVILFSAEEVMIRDDNVTLSLAVTKMGPSVMVTARVLDKGNADSVLLERNVVDTPNVDPTLTSAELLSISGINLALSWDVGLPPYSAGGAVLGMIQYNNGTLPPAVATFDNFQFWLYDNAPLAVSRAVQLTWPAPSTTNYTVEAAPSLRGPWVPVQELQTPGIQKQTVPQNGLTEFFRLRQAP